MKLPIKETIVAASCVAILATLGTWQIERMAWKEKIIAGLEQYYNGQTPAQNLQLGLLDRVDNGQENFGYGFINGHMLKDKAILLGPRMQEGRMGYHLLIPIRTGDKTLVVNAGWVGDLWKDTFEERLSALPADIRAKGVLRKPDWSSFASKNSPDNDLWFRADTQEIAKVKELGDTYSVVLYTDQIDPPLHDVTPHEDKWLPRNKHLQYALFWYAMGAAMIGVYGFYVAGWRKKKAP